MNANIPEPLMKEFEKIAKQHMFVETLGVRNSDRLDFHEVSVWSIRHALNAAYKLGQKSAKTPKRKAPKKPIAIEIHCKVCGKDPYDCRCQ